MNLKELYAFLNEKEITKKGIQIKHPYLALHVSEFTVKLHNLNTEFKNSCLLKNDWSVFRLTISKDKNDKSFEAIEIYPFQLVGNEISFKYKKTKRDDNFSAKEIILYENETAINLNDLLSEKPPIMLPFENEDFNEKVAFQLLFKIFSQNLAEIKRFPNYFLKQCKIICEKELLELEEIKERLKEIVGGINYKISRIQIAYKENDIPLLKKLASRDQFDRQKAIELLEKLRDENAKKISIELIEEKKHVDETIKKIFSLLNSNQKKDFQERKFVFVLDFLKNETSSQIGVYIIKNLENNKYYVGQSTDIYKRISQHFDKNTLIPKNEIFIEDYNNSSFDDKSRLFMIKIIPLKTKDELDVVEKEMIQKFNSFLSGYNRTGGNNYEPSPSFQKETEDPNNRWG